MAGQAGRRSAERGEVRRINVPLGQRFAAAPTFDADTRTVEIVLATETMVRMPGWFLGIPEDAYYEVLECSPAAVDLDQVRAGNCPLLDAHQRWSIKDRLGDVKDGRCEGGQLIVTAALGQSAAARMLEADLAAGTPPKVSAGYKRNQVRFERMEGEIPVYRVISWTLREASFVPIAADPNAGVRSDEHVFPCIIEEGTRAMDANQTGAGAGGAAVEPNPAIEPRSAEPAAPPAGGTRAAADPGMIAQPAQTGVSRFTGASAMAFVETARAFGDPLVTRARELIDKNERGEIGVDAANAELLRAAGEAQRAATGTIGAGGAAVVTADARDRWLAGAANSIIQRAGLTHIVAQAAKLRGETVDLDPGEMRGVRNADLARMALDRAGIRIDSYDRDRIVIAAMTERAGPMNATSDFTVLLENVMHKSLQAAYGVTPDTWRRFCGVGSVTDFRPHNRYLRGTFGALDSKTENGEFKQKHIPDGAKELISAAVKGNIIALTREAIVNDDLGAFSFLATELGRAAKLSIEVDVYGQLAANSAAGPTMNDGNPMFHTSHANIAAVAAPPSVDSFDAIRVLMAQQKDVSGNEYLDIRPHVWLGPIGLGGNARVINGAEYDPDTASKLQKPNMVKGLFNDVVDTPRLAGTRWYAFADPNVAPAIEVVFLNGVQEPYTEQRDGWRVDGTEFKVRFDYGVGGLNFRSAATNAGA